MILQKLQNLWIGRAVKHQMQRKILIGFGDKELMQGLPSSDFILPRKPELKDLKTVSCQKTGKLIPVGQEIKKAALAGDKNQRMSGQENIGLELRKNGGSCPFEIGNNQGRQ